MDQIQVESFGIPLKNEEGRLETRGVTHEARRSGGVEDCVLNLESHGEQEVAICMGFYLSPDKYPCLYYPIQRYTDTLHQRQIGGGDD